MPEYTLNRNYLHRSLQGCTIQFVKGEPTFVPPMCEREVVAIGAERCVGDNPDVLEPEKKVNEAPQGIDRSEQIYSAFDLLVERNDSADFTAAGSPKVKSVEKLVDFNCDAKEISDEWSAYRVAKDAEK